jgi:predicted dehydrogenase
MNILLVGYGFYVTGNEECNGGTIMPSIIKWQSLSYQNIVSLTCLVKTHDSKLNAEQRFSKFINKFKISKNFKVKIKQYDELDEDAKFDCAIIAIPEIYHLECLKYLSKKTNKVICVKPFILNRKELIEAFRISKENDLKVFIDFHKRFDPANIEFIKNASEENHKSGLFNFTYGQKVEMPLKYFKKWSKTSNPFQYLAPHYIDIISQILTNTGVPLNELKIEGSVNFLTFDKNPDLISLVSCNLKFHNQSYYYLVNAICNWMEPKMSPFNSRQRIEFQTKGIHLISEQDNRGQIVIKDSDFSIPNPHFMNQDYSLNFGGYGTDSFCNFFEYVDNRFPENRLVSINDYEFNSQVIDYVNSLLKI